MTPVQKKVAVVVLVAALIAGLILMTSPLASLMSCAQALGFAFLLGLLVGIGRYIYAVTRGKRKADDDLPVRDLSHISDLHRWIALGGLVTVVGVACAGGLPWWGWLTLLSGIWVAVACAPSDLEGLSITNFATVSIGAGFVGGTAAWIATHTSADSGSPLLAGSLIAAVPLLAVAGATRAVWGHQDQDSAQPAVAPVRLRAPAPAADPEAEAKRLEAFRARQQAEADRAAAKAAELAAEADLQRERREKAQADAAAASEKRIEEMRRAQAHEHRLKTGQSAPPPRQTAAVPPITTVTSVEESPKPQPRATNNTVGSFVARMGANAAQLAESVGDHLPNSEETAAAILLAARNMKTRGPNAWVFVGPPGTSKRWLIETLPAWLECGAAQITKESIPTLPIAQAASADAGIMKLIDDVLSKRSDQSNVHANTLILASIDAALDPENPMMSAKKAVASYGTAIGELAEIIPVVGPKTSEDWVRIAMLLLEAKAHINEPDMLLAKAKQVHEYASGLPGGLTLPNGNANLIVAINKLAIH